MREQGNIGSTEKNNKAIREQCSVGNVGGETGRDN